MVLRNRFLYGNKTWLRNVFSGSTSLIRQHIYDVEKRYLSFTRVRLCFSVVLSFELVNAPLYLCWHASHTWRQHTHPNSHPLLKIFYTLFQVSKLNLHALSWIFNCTGFFLIILVTSPYSSKFQYFLMPSFVNRATATYHWKTYMH